MGAPVVLRTGLALTVRLDQEAAEIGHQTVDFGHLRGPPFLHLRLHGVGIGQSAQGFRRAEVDRQECPYSVGTQHIGNGRHLAQHVRRQHRGLGIHIVEHHRVDAYRGIGAGIGFVARGNLLGQLVPPPDGTSGIAALHRPVRIVPMVQHAQVVGWHFRDRLPLAEVRARLLHAQQGVGAIKDSLRGGRHHADAIAPTAEGEPVAVRPVGQNLQDNAPVTAPIVGQLADGDVQRGCPLRSMPQAHVGFPGIPLHAEPKPAAVFCAKQGKTAQRPQHEQAPHGIHSPAYSSFPSIVSIRPSAS